MGHLGSYAGFTIPYQFKTRVKRKHTLFETKKAKIDIEFLTDMAERPYPLGP